MERYLRVNLLGPDPPLMKKEFTGPGPPLMKKEFTGPWAHKG